MKWDATHLTSMEHPELIETKAFNRILIDQFHFAEKSTLENTEVVEEV